MKEIPMTRFTIASVSLAVILMAHVASAQDYSHVKSGMLLGIYTSAAQGGMQISGLIPGYSAQGRLQPGDVLLRVAVDENTMFRLRSLYELEDAKIAIGPNREAALELWRPQVGLMYAWVEFTPIYGPASPAAEAPASAAAALVAPARSAPSPAVITSRGNVRSGNVRSGGPSNAAPAANAVKSYAAQFKLESEKAGARAMFLKQPAAGLPVGGNRSGVRTPVVGNPGRGTQPGNSSGNRSGKSAVDLFKEAKKLIDR
jgi:hypothetical protein